MDSHSRPTIAVVIPSYKCSRTLERAILSIVRQTWSVDEILVIDDCSPDGEKIKAIAESFPGVKYIRNKVNKGLAGTRNVGLFTTHCQVVAFMDADDASHPQRMEIEIKHVAPCAVVTSELMRVSDDYSPEFFYYKKEKIKSKFSAYQNALFTRINGPGLMAETSLLRKVGGYDESLRACEDTDLYLRLLNEGYIIKNVLLPLYIYYDTPGSLSKDKVKVWDAYVKLIDKFVMARFNDSSSYKASLFWFLVLFKEFIRARLDNNKALYEKVLNEMWRVSRLPPLKALLFFLFKKL